VTALIGGDNRVREAHHEAVRTALGEIENYIQARMGGTHAAENTGKMIAAVFQHDSARPVEIEREDGSSYQYPAPHLHDHVVLFNMTEDRTGQARSLQPYELFKIQSMATAVYQNRLEGELRKLGYEIERGTNHAPEIKGYTAEYLASESMRAAQIRETMEKLGAGGRETESIVAHQNRERKLTLTPDELRGLHREHAAESGNQPERVVREAAERHVRAVTPEKAQERAHAAVDFARNRLSERNAVFEHFEVVRDALRHTQGRASLDDVNREVAKQREQGQFIAVEHVRPNAPMHRYTTPELVATERETIQMVLTGQNQPRPTAPVTEAAIRQRYAGQGTKPKGATLARCKDFALRVLAPPLFATPAKRGAPKKLRSNPFRLLPRTSPVRQVCIFRCKTNPFKQKAGIVPLVGPIHNTYFAIDPSYFL
jgi:conjugative relaxase-like TrwC/TraI family protein